MFIKNLYKVSPVFAFLVTWSGPIYLLAGFFGQIHEEVFLNLFLFSLFGSFVSVSADAMREESTPESVWKNFYTGASAGSRLVLKVLEIIPWTHWKKDH